MKLFPPLCVFLVLTFLTFPQTSNEFPLRNVSIVKDASIQQENKDPFLCWVVKIHTKLKCKPLALGKTDKSYQSQRSRKFCEKEHEQFEQHIQDVARELNLLPVHIFTRFQDHVLMCLVEENWRERLRGKAPVLSSISHLHPSLTSALNQSLYMHHKTVTERLLLSHEEVISFHQEYKHQRKSRMSTSNRDGGQNIDENQYRPSSINTGHHQKNEQLNFSSQFLPPPSHSFSRNPVKLKTKAFVQKLISVLKNGGSNNTCSFLISFTRNEIIDVMKKELFQCNNCMSDFEKFYHIVPKQIRKLLHNRSNLLMEKCLSLLINTCGKQVPYAVVLMCGKTTHNSSSFVNFFYAVFCRCSDTDNATAQSIVNCTINALQLHSFLEDFGNKCNWNFNATFITSAIPFNYRENLIFSVFSCSYLSNSSSSPKAFVCDKILIPVLHLRKHSRSTMLRHILCLPASSNRKRWMRNICREMEGVFLVFHNFTSAPSTTQVYKDFEGGDWMRHLRQRSSFSSSSSSLSLLSSKFSSYLNQRKRRRNRRSSSTLPVLFNDPAFPHQWHLWNKATPSMDVNVTGVWVKGYNGSGVVVAVVDDGIEWRNPDLRKNYEYKGSWDFNDDDPDPSPSTSKKANHHGTRCAGEIAAVANNNKCGVGVAYGAKISGIRVLDGVMTDSLEAEAFNKGMEVNDVYSCSWGPEDDGKTVDGPHLMAARAMRHSVEFGRKGYGNIFVVASGNGGVHQDNCNFDGYANSIYTVTIGAVDESGEMPYYAEECASMLGVTFSSGTNNKRDIVTTDWTYDNPAGCTEGHTGTSAAAPLAAGMIALMLQARPCLTWRDVQYIIILTATKVDVDIAHWQQNGAGLSHSHKHGFGLLSSWRIVNAARVWQSVPWITSYSQTSDLSSDRLDVPKGGNGDLLVTWHEVKEEDVRGYSLFIVESVQVTIWLTHPCRGKLRIRMTSPSNTVSVIAAPRPNDNSSSGFQDWTFTTVRCWGESPVGNWTLELSDTDISQYGKGRLTKWRLTIFGTPMSRSEFDERRRQVEDAMSGEFLSPNKTIPCPSAPHKMEEVAILSEKALKILILSGTFCLIMAVYQTLEYICCYNEEKEEYQNEVEQARLARQVTERATRTLENQYSVLPIVDNSPSATDVNGIGRYNTNSFHDNLDLGNNSAIEEDDEEEIFDASETCRLLNDRDANSLSSSSPSSSSTLTRLLSGQQDIGNFKANSSRGTFVPSLLSSSSSSTHHNNFHQSRGLFSSHFGPNAEAIQLTTFNAGGALFSSHQSDDELE